MFSLCSFCYNTSKYISSLFFYNKNRILRLFLIFFRNCVRWCKHSKLKLITERTLLFFVYTSNSFLSTYNKICDKISAKIFTLNDLHSCCTWPIWNNLSYILLNYLLIMHVSSLAFCSSSPSHENKQTD